MEIRHTTEKDLPRIMAMVADAKAWFKAEGIDQWQDGYPTREIFEADCAQQSSYVGLQEGEILLTGCLSFAGEPTYRRIYDGAWLNEAPYAVIHRLVVARERKGERLAEVLFRFAFATCRHRQIENLRVDTHRQNYPMQHLLRRLGFQHCGRILLESGAEREAYQLILSPDSEHKKK